MDTALLRRWQRGDRFAGEELINRYSDMVHEFLAPRVGGRVDDLLQQVFLALLESGERFQGRSSVKTYLFAIARRQLYAHYRRQRRDVTQGSSALSTPDLGTSPSAGVARQQTHQLLHMALRSLPVDQQITLELLYWWGMQTAEVAEVLDVPVSTVYTRAQRARNRLREALLELHP